MDEDDRTARKVAQLREERGPDPAPAKPPSLKEVPDQEWNDAWVAVLTYGLGVTGSLDHADEIRQEAYVRLLTTRPWTPARGMPFERHAVLVAVSVRKHMRKAEFRRARKEADAGAAHIREVGVTTTSPEQDILAYAQSERKRSFAGRVLDELCNKLEGFPLELALLSRAAMQEVESKADDEPEEKPAETAKALGVRVEEVYRARARIKRYKEGAIAAARSAAGADDADGVDDGAPGESA